MIYRKLAVVIGAVLLLGLIGSVAGPGWAPQPVEHSIVPQTADVAIGSNVATDPVGTYPVASRTFDVQLDGAVVQATLTYPVGAPPERPGVLFMHGAGTGSNTNFGWHAEALASAGVYVLVPEKRMDTYTTRDRNYPTMARDYLVSLEVLRGEPGVDPERVGVYGESEGAWIAPIAAALDPAVAFVILVSAPVVPPREQAAFATDSYLRTLGVPDSLLRAIPRGLGMAIPGGGFAYADFDASGYVQRMSQPVLMIYGTADASMPTVQGPLQLIDDMALAGNHQYTIRYFEGANHGMKVDGQLAPGFTDVLARWTLALPEAALAEPRIAGAQPEQRFRADPVDHPRWFADGDMIVVTFFASLGLLAVGPVLWVATRIARRRAARPMPPPLARYSAATALSTLAVLVVFVAYLVQVAHLALTYRTNDWLVHGGWIGVQALGILAVAVLVRSASAAINAVRTLGPSMGALARMTWWGIHAGALSLLVIAAYWGVFPAVL